AHEFGHALAVFDDLAVAANHDAAQLRVALAALRHDRDLGVAPDVHHLLRLAVGRHVDRAVKRDKVHRDQVRKPFLVHGGERDLAAFAEKLDLLFTGKLDLFAPIHSDGSLRAAKRTKALTWYVPARIRQFDRWPAVPRAGAWRIRATRESFRATLPGL